jgi:hypothetical protein
VKSFGPAETARTTQDCARRSRTDVSPGLTRLTRFTHLGNASSRRARQTHEGSRPIFRFDRAPLFILRYRSSGLLMPLSFIGATVYWPDVSLGWPFPDVAPGGQFPDVSLGWPFPDVAPGGQFPDVAPGGQFPPVAASPRIENFWPLLFVIFAVPLICMWHDQREARSNRLRRRFSDRLLSLRSD